MNTDLNIRLNIRRLIEKGDLSKVKLAEKVGLSRSHLHSITDGDAKLYWDFIEKIAEIYNISVLTLIGYNLEEIDKVTEEKQVYKKTLSYDKKVDMLLEDLRDVLMTRH